MSEIGIFATVERTSENVHMNEQVAHALIDAERRRLQQLSYSDLTALIGEVETKELGGEDGKIYQLEIQAFWDSSLEIGCWYFDSRWNCSRNDRGFTHTRPPTTISLKCHAPLRKETVLILNR